MVTSYPADRNWSTMWLPISPAPPVTRTRCDIAPAITLFLHQVQELGRPRGFEPPTFCSQILEERIPEPTRSPWVGSTEAESIRIRPADLAAFATARRMTGPRKTRAPLT